MPAAVKSLVAGQVSSPVRWMEQVEAMYEAGARVFVEAGAGRVLTQTIRKILGDRPHVAVACDAAGDNGLTRLQLALAELSVNGVDVDPAHCSPDAPHVSIWRPGRRRHRHGRSAATW